ncbi:MaoC family dehydratase N-terminal domain-containing protein [Pseudonocardia pini]|uniref:MaoC family dehydratase N-terminal domain-containing protein n=1 Tax=Pseudonocardia pini TaxID=2758030 RepID=UPI0015F12042|nr:MaoC family dehydratase N-terminal domain-containing protein [Pseudonocardia pini]
MPAPASAVVAAVVGRRQEPVTVDVERGRLRMFAQAIGETDPVYSDVAAARAAGHPDLPAPPTILFGLDLERADTLGFLAGHGIDLGAVLHGEQAFTYHVPVYAGDTLTFASEFTEAYSKAGGKLDFLVRRTRVTRGGELVAELDNTAVIRNGAAA